MTPSARSMRFLAETGWSACVVEKWIPGANIRKDAYGWGDILACHPERSGALLVQTTTGAHVAERIAKARGNPALIKWLTAGNSLIAHGWRKLKGRWEVSQRTLEMSDLVPSTESEGLIQHTDHTEDA